MGFLDEVLQHHLSDIEIGNHPVFHRPHRLNGTWCPTQHDLGVITNCQFAAVFDHLRGAVMHRDHAGL